MYDREGISRRVFLDTASKAAVATSCCAICQIALDPLAGAVSAQPATASEKPETALPQEVRLDLGGGVTMGLVLVPAGEFMMGSDDPEAQPSEKPVHKVKISKPYYIGKYEVTVAQFRRFAETANYQTECEKAGDRGTSAIPVWGERTGINWKKPGFPQGPDHPVVLVSWNDAKEFCKWATGQLRSLPLAVTGAGTGVVRLPTEAEWEYAARGPENWRYPWGNAWDGTRLNHGDVSFKNAGPYEPRIMPSSDDDGFAYTAPVGSYKDNDVSWCGAHDLAGNVTEWCADYFSATYYAQSPAADPKGPTTGRTRVGRPGCWYDGAPAACRSARRVGNMASEDRNTGVGFRVVLAARAGAPADSAQAERKLEPKLVAPCGIYCGKCEGLIKSIYAKDPKDVGCLGCLSDKVPDWSVKECKIRPCAIEKKVESCAVCADYLCGKLKQFQKPDWQREPANNLKRIAEQGLEQWKREQKARWSCKQCGALFSDKDKKCRKCGKPV